VRKRSGVAIAARQMVVEELIDEVFVELLSYQAAARHPMGEVRQGAQAFPDATFGVAALLSSAKKASRCDDSGPSSNQARAKGCSVRNGSMLVSSCETNIPAPTLGLCTARQNRHAQQRRCYGALQPAAQSNCFITTACA